MSNLKDNKAKKEMMRNAGFGEEIKNVEMGLCAICKDPVKVEDLRDALSVKEYNISGMCQCCQDSIFGK